MNQKTSKKWFARKTYGYGWTPVSWEGWSLVILSVLVMIRTFLLIDAQSPSSSSTLIQFMPRFLLILIILSVISIVKGETPRWQWGEKKEATK